MENKDFRIAVVTVSDRSSRGERKDESGPLISDLLASEGFVVSSYSVIPDEYDTIRATLIRLTDVKEMDLIITTGGTGFAERDVTPEATLSIKDKVVPGIAEAIRSYSLKKTPHAMLSRGVAVLRKRTLIVNFAGSPKAVEDSIAAIKDALPHGLGMLRGMKLDK